jgi:spore germination protein
LIKRHFYRKRKKDTHENKQSADTDRLKNNLETNVNYFNKLTEQHPDLTIRSFRIGGTNIQAACLFMKEMVDEKTINEQILDRLMHNWDEFTTGETEFIQSDEIINLIKNHVLSFYKIKSIQSYSDIFIHLIRGSTAVLVDGCDQAIVMATSKKLTTSLGPSETEAIVRGPQIGFTNSLEVNLALLRQSLATPNLTYKSYVLGRRTQRKASVVYIQDLADPELVKTVDQRIKEIDIDEVLDTSYIEHLIEDNTFSPFPQVQDTERPDRVAGALTEGRVAILLDGTSFALIVPVTFWMFLQSPEDYYTRWIPGILLRYLRYMSAFLSISLPAFYIAFTSFHQGLIPTRLAMSIAATREGVPFPSVLEALFMEVAVEVLREAGLRLPKSVGQTVGIVGGLVIGESAAQAGIVSPILLVVVAVTAISSFAIPQYNAGIALRYLRFVLMLFAAFFGLYGIIIFFLLTMTHLVRLESFGFPYLAPIAPIRTQDWKDILFRAPLSRTNRRPVTLKTQDPVRQKQ